MKDNLKLLAPVLGEDKAKEVIKLTSNYDKYVEKFKKNINDILEPLGYEMKIGVAFVKKETPSKK